MKVGDRVLLFAGLGEGLALKRSHLQFDPFAENMQAQMGM